MNPSFYWLFDPRYDFILKYFVSYLRRHGLQNPKPVQALSYRRPADWDTICLWPNEDGSIFRIAEPDVVNRRFEEHIAHLDSRNILVAAVSAPRQSRGLEL